MVDFPAPGDAPDSGGGVDLPVIRGAAPPPGEIDLPMMPHAAPPTSGGFGEIDLPAARPAPPRPPPPKPSGSFGEVDLPIVPNTADLPVPGGAGLPSASGFAGLPSPSGGPGLPAPGGGAGLPAPRGAGLPAPRAVGLPAPAGAGLPIAAGAGLPSAAGAGLPTAAGAGLPSSATAGFPATAGAGFPSAAHAGLPTVGPGFPVTSQGGLPSASDAFPSSADAFPSSADAFPMHSDQQLPSRVDSDSLPGALGNPIGLDSGGGRPLPSGGLPLGSEADLAIGTGQFGFGNLGGESPLDVGDSYEAHGSGEASLGGGDPFGGFGDDDPMAGAGGVDAGNISFGGEASGIGGEVELDGAALPATGLPQANKSPKTAAESLAPDAGKKSPMVKYVAVGVIGFIVVGGVLSFFPKIGPFGFNLVSDAVNAGAYDASLNQLREQARGQLDEDVFTQANAAVAAGSAAYDEAKRHEATAAYSAYLIYMRSLRFGRDAGEEEKAKQRLDGQEGDSLDLKLAQGARDAVDGQLARARQNAAAVLSKQPDNVDAAVLAGEIELAAKAPAKAVAAWELAVKVRESARTLYGLARAQRESGQLEEAEATARKVLQASSNHVAARILIASIAADSAARDEEAKSMLEKVTADEKISAGASADEKVAALTQLGLLHLARTRMSDAQQAFEQAITLDERNEDTLIGYGEYYYMTGNFIEASAKFDGATRASPDNVRAKVGTAKTLLAQNKASEAKSQLTKLHAAHPKDPTVALWLGKAEESLGKNEAAEAAYGKAIEAATDNPIAVQAYVALAELLSKQDRASEAEAKLKEANEKFPDLPQLHKAKGAVFMRNGNFDRALEEFDKALNLKGWDDLETRFFKGVALRELRRFDDATQVFEQVAGLDKQFPGLALERGLLFESTGQSDRALEMYREEERKDPENMDLKLRIAASLVLNDQFEPALEYLGAVLKDRPNSGEGLYLNGRALLGLGRDLGNAERSLESAYRNDPNRAEYALYVGWVKLELGKNAEADEALKNTLSLNKNLGEAYWLKAEIKLKDGASLDALEDVKKALEKNPSLYQAYATAALAHEAQNNLTAAEEAWQQAIAGNPNNPFWRFRLGKLYADRNNREGAINMLEKACSLGDGKEPPPRWLHTPHRLLAEQFDAQNEKDSAIKHYKRFLALSPSDNVYRPDVIKRLDSLGSRN